MRAGSVSSPYREVLRLIKAAAMIEVVLVRSVTRRWVYLLNALIHL